MIADLPGNDHSRRVLVLRARCRDRAAEGHSGEDTDAPGLNDEQARIS